MAIFRSSISAWQSLILAGLAVSLSACSARPAAPTASLPDNPIGSTSLCGDSYLLAMAPDRIAALSWQAGSSLSTATEAQAALPRVWASREILAGTDMPLLLGPSDQSFGQGSTLALVWGEDFDSVQQNILNISAYFDLDSGVLLTRLDTLKNLPQPDTPPRIFYLSRSGGSAGPGTYVDAVIQAAGGININETPGWHTPSVERILQFKPDLILTSFFDSDYAGVNDRALRHSALRRVLAQYPTVEIPGKLWPCAGPGLIEATERLNQAIVR